MMEETRYVFPDGRIALVMGKTVRWEDLAGCVRGYGLVEHITVPPTLGEAYLTQRGIQ